MWTAAGAGHPTGLRRSRYRHRSLRLCCVSRHLPQPVRRALIARLVFLCRRYSSLSLQTSCLLGASLRGGGRPHPPPIPLSLRLQGYNQASLTGRLARLGTSLSAGGRCRRGWIRCLPGPRNHKHNSRRR